MKASDIMTSLPVIEGGRLVGILTDGDLLRRPELGTAREAGWPRSLFAPAAAAGDFIKTHGRRVSEVMTPDPVSIPPNMPLDEAVDLMTERRFKQIPVVKDHALAGLLGRQNLLAALAGRLIAVSHEATSDRAAEALILRQVSGLKWAPRAGIEVHVADGVAELSGPVFSDAERRALMVIAETTERVKDVRDKMVFVDPNTGMAFGTF